MALINEEIIWLKRNNSIDFILYANDSAVDLTSVNKIQLALGTCNITSTDSTDGYIKWALAGYSTGEIRIVAGAHTSLTTGNFEGTLIVFDPSNTAGIVWDNNIPIRIAIDPLAT